MNRRLYQYLLVGTLVVAGAIQMACAGNSNKPKETGKDGYIVVMTDSMFRTQVFDYKSGSEAWEYLGEKPAIIDFYADWCGPCRAIAPILKELAETYKDSITIYKVNVDKERALAGWAGIQSIPAVLFVPMEGQPQMMVGQQPKEFYIEAIRKFLLGK